MPRSSAIPNSWRSSARMTLQRRPTARCPPSGTFSTTMCITARGAGHHVLGRPWGDSPEGVHRCPGLRRRAVSRSVGGGHRAGLRLAAAGGSDPLDPAIQGTHLKPTGSPPTWARHAARRHPARGPPLDCPGPGTRRIGDPVESARATPRGGHPLHDLDRLAPPAAPTLGHPPRRGIPRPQHPASTGWCSALQVPERCGRSWSPGSAQRGRPRFDASGSHLVWAPMAASPGPRARPPRALGSEPAGRSGEAPRPILPGRNERSLRCPGRHRPVRSPARSPDPPPGPLGARECGIYH